MPDMTFQEALIKRYARQIAEETHDRMVRNGLVVEGEEGFLSPGPNACPCRDGQKWALRCKDADCPGPYCGPDRADA